MRKAVVFLMLLLLLSLTACGRMGSTGNKPEISETTITNTAEISTGSDILHTTNEIIVKLTATKNSILLNVKNEVGLLEAMENSLINNPTMLNMTMNDSYINKAKKSGLVIEAAYQTGKELYVADSKDAITVDKIIFIIQDARRLVAVYSKSNIIVMEIPEKTISDISQFIA